MDMAQPQLQSKRYLVVLPAVVTRGLVRGMSSPDMACWLRLFSSFRVLRRAVRVRLFLCADCL